MLFRSSKRYYGADVAGTVFKKVSDHIYRRFLTKPKQKQVAIDTTVYSYFGTRSDLQTIFSGINIAFKDSLNSGLWQTASVKNKSAQLVSLSDSLNKMNVIPNLKGMGLKDALYLLENKGLVAVVSGRGKVVSQSLVAGTNFTKGQKIILMLN